MQSHSDTSGHCRCHESDGLPIPPVGRLDSIEFWTDGVNGALGAMVGVLERIPVKRRGGETVAELSKRHRSV